MYDKGNKKKSKGGGFAVKRVILSPQIHRFISFCRMHSASQEGLGVVNLRCYFCFFFFLDKKETIRRGGQESLISPHRHHGIAGFQASRAASELF